MRRWVVGSPLRAPQYGSSAPRSDRRRDRWGCRRVRLGGCDRDGDRDVLVGRTGRGTGPRARAPARPRWRERGWPPRPPADRATSGGVVRMVSGCCHPEAPRSVAGGSWVVPATACLAAPRADGGMPLPMTLAPTAIRRSWPRVERRSRFGTPAAWRGVVGPAICGHHHQRSTTMDLSLLDTLIAILILADPPPRSARGARQHRWHR